MCVGMCMYSPLSCPPLVMSMEPSQRSLLFFFLPASPLPPAGQRSVKLPLFQVLQALEDERGLLLVFSSSRYSSSSSSIIVSFEQGQGGNH